MRQKKKGENEGRNIKRKCTEIEKERSCEIYIKCMRVCVCVCVCVCAKEEGAWGLHGEGKLQ